jgi:hypothetical protein
MGPPVWRATQPRKDSKWHASRKIEHEGVKRPNTETSTGQSVPEMLDIGVGFSAKEAKPP